MNYTYKYNSPLGEIIAQSDGLNLSGLWLPNQKYSPYNLTQVDEAEKMPIFESVKAWLDCYFAGKKPDFCPAISMTGSSFRMAVWECLCEIPYGELITYGDIAKKIAVKFKKSKMSAQAVGGAVGHNPVSIIVPCHRVVGVNGNLTGYGGGIDIKIKLLALEGVDISKLYIPKTGTAL